MRCSPTQKDLDKLREVCNILDDIHRTIPGEGDIPSRPPKECVTLYLECFRLSVRLPLQPYFIKVLGRIYLAHGQLNSNGWRVLSGLFVFVEEM